MECATDQVRRWLGGQHGSGAQTTEALVQTEGVEGEESAKVEWEARISQAENVASKEIEVRKRVESDIALLERTLQVLIRH